MTPDNLDHCHRLAIQAALAGAVELRAGANRRGRLAVELKAPNVLVCEVDRESEAAIVQCIRLAFPDHDILAEEGQGGRRRSPWLWLIDPLDGTTNFVHGFEHYAVSVGLQYHDQMVVGVILDPVRGQLFSATLGGGAFLNGRRLQVSSTSRLREALVATGLPQPDAEDASTYFRLLHDVWQGCRDVRRPGCAALDLAYVAAGWMDGFFQFGLTPWEVGAGALLVQEAGGEITSMTGENDFFELGHVVAGSPAVHRELLVLAGAHMDVKALML